MAKLKVHIPTFTLNNGVRIPALGYGTWIGENEKGEFNYSHWDKMKETLSYSIDAGYRYIDTAHFYRVEPAIGEVIKQKIKGGVVKREELFITTKVHMHDEANVEVSVRGSLIRLDLDYLDLVLVHWPMSINQEGVNEPIDYLKTWRGFELILRKGLVRSIGVSNFNVDQLKRLLASCKVKPVVNQVEINLAFGQKELVNFCTAHDIRVNAWAPFGSMIASRAPADAPEPKIDNPTIVAIAQKYGKTVWQVTLRYLYQRGIITIPKTVTASRVIENASIFDFELTPLEFSSLAKFDINYRSSTPAFCQYYAFEKYDAPANQIRCDSLVIEGWCEKNNK